MQLLNEVGLNLTKSVPKYAVFIHRIFASFVQCILSVNVIFCCFWPNDRPFSYSANQRRRCGGRHGDVRVIGQTTRSRGTGDGKGTNNNNAETPQNAQYTRGVTVQQVNISGYLHTHTHTPV